MKITAKAPCKVIISGEHSVIYSAPALAMAIEPFNTVTLTTETKKPGITLKLKGKEVQLNEKGDVVAGAIDWNVYTQLVKHLVKREIIKIKEKTPLIVEIESNVPKGVGASSSIAAALCIALYKHGEKTLNKETIFSDVQFVDKIAHGGNPSGIDAYTVLFGSSKLTRVVEQSSPKWMFEKMNVTLPSGTTLIVIDTFQGGNRSGTGEMIELFARNTGLANADGSIKQLQELTQSDKEKLELFAEVFKKIVKELKEDGDAALLGQAMNENHYLLALLGVSSLGIEEARKIAIDAGAFGAKLTGAGGEGGAVITLVKTSEAQNIIRKLNEKGFNAFEAKPAKGALE